MVSLGITNVWQHTFVRNCQTVILSGFTILHFHQQSMRVSVEPHPYLCLLLLFIWIFFCFFHQCFVFSNVQILHLVMHCLITKMGCKECIVRQFCCCVSILECTYTDLGYMPRLYGIPYCSQAANLYSVLLYYKQHNSIVYLNISKLRKGTIKIRYKRQCSACH